MKRILLFVWLSPITGFSQITTPIVKANFGIEADISSNYFNNLPQPAVDDWFANGYAGTGQFIIDTTGAAAILANYNNNPNSRKLPFSKLMKQASYTTLNNRILIDAIFHRDYHGDDSTVFASGSNKNGMTPADWSCPVSQSIPDKNDILDAFTHVRRAGPNVTDSMWMFSGIAIENTNGSRYFDFELYQTNISYNRNTRTFQNYGPDAGHTSWKFDAAGNILSPGDIIFTAEFGSSSLTLVEARIWIKQSDLSLVPTAFKWGGQFDGAGTGASFGYASILPKSAGAFYTGLQTATNTVWTGPFSLVRDNNTLANTYQTGQFMEFSVNLTKLGIDPSTFMNNGCGTPFRRVLIKTRASTSFTAELKDFIAPFSMFNFPVVDAVTPSSYYCGAMPQAVITVSNPLSTSIYNWTTTTGHIIGTTNGSSITVDAPGTYYVTQQLHSQCPAYAVDSLKIFYDTVCTLLNLNLTRFNALKQNSSEALIQWTVNNNELAKSYLLEYSFNDREYFPVSEQLAATMVGTAQYGATFPTTGLSNQLIYFRLKMLGRNEVIKVSKTIVLQLPPESKTDFAVYPNPIHHDATAIFWSAKRMTGNLTILDANGRLIRQIPVLLNTGKNFIQLHSYLPEVNGMYAIQLTADGRIYSYRILITR